MYMFSILKTILHIPVSYTHLDVYKRQVVDGKDYTKFPLTKRDDVGQAPTGFFPYTSVPTLEGGVTYFMC